MRGRCVHVEAVGNSPACRPEGSGGKNAAEGGEPMEGKRQENAGWRRREKRERETERDG